MSRPRQIAALAATVLTAALALPATPASAAPTVADSAGVRLAPASAAAALPAAQQPGAYTLRLSRVSNARPVVVTWGDGTTTRQRSSCSPAKVARTPKACSMRLTHVYAAPGTYSVVLRFGKKVFGRQKAVIPFQPRGWQPPAGWVQPAGWTVLPGGATFAPCSTVSWFYDAAGQPAGSAGMKTDVAAGLALLAPQTGLTFVETADRGAAQLVFGWADLAPKYGGDVGGVGGRDATSAYVRFSTTNWWTADAWPGFDVVTQPDGRQAHGRGWLVVHEVMHSLGFDHIDDRAQIMNPVIAASGLGSGDLDGLRTMYLSQPCPA